MRRRFGRTSEKRGRNGSIRTDARVPGSNWPIECGGTGFNNVSGASRGFEIILGSLHTKPQRTMFFTKKPFVDDIVMVNFTLDFLKGSFHPLQLSSV